MIAAVAGATSANASAYGYSTPHWSINIGKASSPGARAPAVAGTAPTHRCERSGLTATRANHAIPIGQIAATITSDTAFAATGIAPLLPTVTNEATACHAPG